METTIAALADAGFDLAHAFDANAAARESGLACLAGDRAQLGILVGNTRALWPRFVAAMRAPELAADPHPLERYVEDSVARALADRTARVYYAHRRYDGVFLPFQRLAVVAGLAALAPTQLAIHPIYGPWFALRAAIVVDGHAPSRTAIEKPCRCTERCESALRTALRAGTDWRTWLAVRDACELKAWRYSDDQIEYHYTKAWPDDREVT